MFMNQDWNTYKDVHKPNLAIDVDADLANVYRGPCMWAYKTASTAWAPINMQTPTSVVGEVGLVATDLYAPGMQTVVLTGVNT